MNYYCHELLLLKTNNNTLPREMKRRAEKLENNLATTQEVHGAHELRLPYLPEHFPMDKTWIFKF